MKTALKIVTIFSLLLSVILPIYADTANSIPYAEQTDFLYLFMGVDDTSGNTDSIIAASYCTEKNTLNFLQIPRDTFCVFNDEPCKLNSIYKKINVLDNTESVRINEVSSFFGNAFGVEFNGIFTVNLDAFVNFIDIIGGVTVNLPEPLSYNESNYSFYFPAGENVLDGTTAKMFVRHRKGYNRGDLARIDAQKIFIAGLYDTLMHRAEYKDIIKAFTTVRGDVESNFSVLDFVFMLLRHSSKFRDARLGFSTLAGEPLIHNNSSYYILNKSANDDLVKSFLTSKCSGFDKNGIFSSSNVNIMRIYKSNKILYKILTIDDINNLKLQ